MARATQDVTIWDETSDYALAIDSSGRLTSLIQDGGGSITIDATTLPLPTGAATEATLATRASETTLAAINAKLVSGTDIGDVTINNAAGASAVNIQDGGNSITVDGSVAVTSVVPGTGATNLGKAEDAAHATGDVGVMALAVRNDAGTALAGATGDYIPLGTDANGNLRVVQPPFPSNVIVYKAGMLLNGSSGAQNVNGSGTPVNFDFTPASGETWYLESLGFLIIDGTTPDANEYGSLGSALTNGLQILIRVNGTEYEFTNITINAHLTALFTQTGVPLGSLGWLNDNDAFVGGLNFQQPIRLTNSTGDYVRFRVRDNLTGITHQYATYKAWRTV